MVKYGVENTEESAVAKRKLRDYRCLLIATWIVQTTLTFVSQ